MLLYSILLPSRPLPTYAPWFSTVLKAARLAIKVIQMLSQEVSPAWDDSGYHVCQLHGSCPHCFILSVDSCLLHVSSICYWYGGCTPFLNVRTC